MIPGSQSTQKFPYPAGSDSLSEKQRTAIALLLTGKTNTATAEGIGVSRRTIWGWRQDPAFAASLNAELEALREAAQVRMLALAEKAFDALERTLANADSDSARIAAVKLVLERVVPSNAPPAEEASKPPRVLVVTKDQIERMSELQRLDEMQRRSSQPKREAEQAMAALPDNKPAGLTVSERPG